VPLITLNSVACPDAEPNDGQWACGLDATGRADGDVINVTVRATDVFGQQSNPIGPRAFVVDTIPPTTSIDLAAGSVTSGQSLDLTGQVQDNHGLGRVEVCVDNAACEVAALDQSGADQPRSVDDVPDNPISIDGAATCGSGEIVRTFVVTDTFAVGDVTVGLNATHALRDELRAELESPLGTRVRLTDDDGLGGTTRANYDVSLNDAASAAYSAPAADDVAAPYFERSARPAQPLRAFAGQAAAGTWTLHLCDTSAADNDGAYQRRQLRLTPQADRVLARDGQWSYAVTLNDQQDFVAHTVSVYGVDAAGNRATNATAQTFVADNVAPVLTVTKLIETAVLTHSVPVLNIAATDGGSVNQVYVIVEAPNETYAAEATRDGNGWRFDLQPAQAGTYTLQVSAYDAAQNVSLAGPFGVAITEPTIYQAFLPLVTQAFVAGPDLAVNRLLVTNTAVQVIIKNQGNEPVTDEFWVDVYVNPRSAPTGVNQTWSSLGAQGLTWGVTAAALPQLVPGGVLTLTVNDAYFWPSLSKVTWPLANGTPVYAQVDAANAGVAYGAVLELDELPGVTYNNVFGPMLVGAATQLSARAASVTIAPKPLAAIRP